MDPEYLQMLMEMMAQADMGGPAGGPELVFGPNGQQPQYRSQFTGYVSDGTVRDLLGKVLTDQSNFSTDAFFDLDPALKPIVARAVAEGGHDPFSVYSLADDDAYQKALLDAAIRSQGLPEFTPNLEGVADTNMDDRVDAGDLTAEQYRQQALGSLAGQRVVSDTPMRNAYGDVIQSPSRGDDAVSGQLSAYQQALDDFITQAAPSDERNLNDLDFAWGRLGGMPFPGMGGGTTDFAGTGPAFPEQMGGLGQAAQAVSARSMAGQNDPALGEFVEQYLRDHGVDIEGNRRRRDEKARNIRQGVAQARGSSSRRSGGGNKVPLRSQRGRQAVMDSVQRRKDIFAQAARNRR